MLTVVDFVKKIITKRLKQVVKLQNSVDIFALVGGFRAKVIVKMYLYSFLKRLCILT